MTELRDAHKADKILFLGVSVREFLEEISFLFSRLSKEICLTKVDGHHTIPGVEESKKAILYLSELGYPLPPELGNWRLLVLTPLDS